jgi:hypothetical protein
LTWNFPELSVQSRIEGFAETATVGAALGLRAPVGAGGANGSVEGAVGAAGLADGVVVPGVVGVPVAGANGSASLDGLGRVVVGAAGGVVGAVEGSTGLVLVAGGLAAGATGVALGAVGFWEGVTGRLGVEGMLGMLGIEGMLGIDGIEGTLGVWVVGFDGVDCPVGSVVCCGVFFPAGCWVVPLQEEEHDDEQEEEQEVEQQQPCLRDRRPASAVGVNRTAINESRPANTSSFFIVVQAPQTRLKCQGLETIPAPQNAVNISGKAGL